MPEELNEPNKFDEDKAIEEASESIVGDEQPQVPEKESSPETVEPDKKEEGGSDPQKTPSTPEESEETVEPEPEIDKGFSDNPKWQKLLRERNEAREERDKFERSNASYSQLLNDPEIYQKHLKRQGLSEFEIEREMKAKGFPTDNAKGELSTFDAVNKKLNYKLDGMKPEEVQYLRDLNANTEAVVEHLIAKRIAPLQSAIQNREEIARVDQGISQAKKIAETEGIEWKVAEVAMRNTLTTLDSDRTHDLPRNSQGQVMITPVHLYQMSTRQVLIERSNKSQSQQERDERKKNARPLLPGATIPSKAKGEFEDMSEDEISDKFLAGVGYKE